MQAEEITLKLRKELGEEIAQMAVEEQESQTPVPGPRCKKCRREMRYRGEKETRVESRVGNLHMCQTKNDHFRGLCVPERKH